MTYLTLDGETLETTHDHPFYTADGEWVGAGSLVIGERVLRADGGYGTVEAITVSADVQPMHNLEVDAVHTYFVGDGQWVVHNGCLLVAYHGTTTDQVESLKLGVQPTTSGQLGPGFYASFDYDTAFLFAQDAAQRAGVRGIDAEPVVVGVYVEQSIFSIMKGVTQTGTLFNWSDHMHLDFIEAPVSGLPGHSQIKFNPEFLINLEIRGLEP
ncbi:hypothetical protein HC928_20470 [bacterium]|nr:hypothetical protein [bacterium]